MSEASVLSHQMYIMICFLRSNVSDLSVCSQQQPCLHAATCVMEDSGEYTCMCPEGFHGRNCQLRAGPCHQRRSDFLSVCKLYISD